MTHWRHLQVQVGGESCIAHMSYLNVLFANYDTFLESKIKRKEFPTLWTASIL